MSHRTLTTACFTFALLAGLGAAHAMPLPPLHGSTAAVKVAEYGVRANRAYGYRDQAPRSYGYDARNRSYGQQDDEINALQYVYPQTYGWPRGTDNQF